MTMTTKKALQGLILLFLMANLTVIGMDLAQTQDEKMQQIDRILYASFDPKTFKAEFKGTVTLKGTSLGYGCQSTIDKLKKNNINTEQNWPLAAVALNITHKTSLTEEPIQIDITQAVPIIAIKNIIENNMKAEISAREQKLVALLENESDEFQNTVLCKLEGFRDLMAVRIGNRIEVIEEKTTPLPPLLPAHLFHSHKITIKDLFDKSSNVTFIFDGHQQLESLTNQFEKTPTIFTYLSQTQINELATLQDDHARLAHLNLCYVFANPTNIQLAQVGIIARAIPNQYKECTMPSTDVIAYQSKSYKHGTHGNPDMSSIVIAQQLKNQKAPHFVARRQAMGNKRHFTCSLKK